MPKIRSARNLQVKIDAFHIEEARRCTTNQCAIAIAIQEKFPAMAHIEVDMQSIRFSDHKRGIRYVYLTSPEAQDFLRKWDGGVRNLKPFTVKLSQGFTKAAGWKANHPNSERRGKAYSKTGVKRFVPTKTREFGARVFKSTE